MFRLFVCCLARRRALRPHRRGNAELQNETISGVDFKARQDQIQKGHQSVWRQMKISSSSSPKYHRARATLILNSFGLKAFEANPKPKTLSPKP